MVVHGGGMCFGAEKWDTSGDASVRAIGQSFGLYVIRMSLARQHRIYHFFKDRIYHI